MERYGPFPFLRQNHGLKKERPRQASSYDGELTGTEKRASTVS
jgi:hypothetical protein